jgi:hypothetical protein
MCDNNDLVLIPNLTIEMARHRKEMDSKKTGAMAGFKTKLSST